MCMYICTSNSTTRCSARVCALAPAGTGGAQHPAAPHGVSEHAVPLDPPGLALRIAAREFFPMFSSMFCALTMIFNFEILSGPCGPDGLS